MTTVEPDNAPERSVPSTQDRIDDARQQAERAQRRARRHGHFRFFFLLEGTGATFAVFILLYRYVFPWFPSSPLGALVFIFLYGMILDGYNDAQRRAIDNSTEDKDLGKDDLLGRDTLLSTLPLISYGIIFLITMFGLFLKFKLHMFNDPSNAFWNNFWETRLIGPNTLWAWGFWIMSIPFFKTFWGDLTMNQKLAVRLTRRGGMQSRNEHRAD